jgi:hypothetical protein
VNTGSDGSKELPATTPVLPREAVQRWRLVVARDTLAPDQVGREQQAAWGLALGASGLPVAGLDAPEPRARFVIAAPLAAAIPGEAELVDTWMVERVPAWRIREALSGCLPAGWRLVDAYDVWLGEPALPGRVAASVYRATFGPASDAGRAVLAAAVDALLGESTLPRERRKGEASVAYDLRPFLEAIDVEPAPDGGTVLRITLRHDPERGVGRPDEALAALGARAGLVLQPDELVRERLVLADPPPPAPPAPRRAPPRRPGSGRG